jgi:hypothetical protein
MKNFGLKHVVKRPAQEPRCKRRDNIKTGLKAKHATRACVGCNLLRRVLRSGK